MQTLSHPFSVSQSSHPKPMPAERALTVASGALLLLPVVGKRSAWRWTAAAAGGALIYCGLSDSLSASRLIPASHGVSAKQHITQTVTIGKPVHDVYNLWRDLDVLAKIKLHFMELTTYGPDHIRWTYKLPVGSLSLEAILVEERTNELVHWRSTSAGPLQVDERMRLKPAARERGTEATLDYQIDFSRVPAGDTLRALTAFFERAPQLALKKLLYNFKSFAETGEIPTLQRNPSARASKHNGKGDMA